MAMLSRRDFILANVGAAFSHTALSGLFGNAYAEETGAEAQPIEATRLNVLFIAVDDLRPLLGCYGDPLAHTPHIDRLAKEGLLFKRAYCQQAICSPSRSSLLTGRRPDTTRVYYNQTHFRAHIPNVVTLPQHFKAHGYHTQSLGKVFHGKNLDDEPSWSVPSAWFTDAPPYHMPESLARVTTITRGGRTRRTGPSWECSDNDDHAHNDGQIADAAIEALQKLKDKPFFLAVGFRKPHLPFVAPRKYFSLHPPEKFRLPSHDEAPQGAPAWAMHNWGELRNYVDIPEKGPLSKEKAIELIRAYYAATSFIDAQIGRVLKALDENGLRQNTVVVLWGDHGWHLGDHGLWCKHTNFERATHAPLVLRAPGMKASGMSSDALVEFVDIYPTLVELCGLPLPDGLEGASFVPLLANPNQAWKKAAFSQYPRQTGEHGFVMGYSMRTPRYRLTEWRTRDSMYAPNNEEVIGTELYDYLHDPGETVNRANLPENAAIVKRLTELLHGGWKNALP
jgi:iduronate 2-sulfatase